MWFIVWTAPEKSVKRWIVLWYLKNIPKMNWSKYMTILRYTQTHRLLPYERKVNSKWYGKREKKSSVVISTLNYFEKVVQHVYYILGYNIYYMYYICMVCIAYTYIHIHSSTQNGRQFRLHNCTFFAFHSLSALLSLFLRTNCWFYQGICFLVLVLSAAITFFYLPPGHFSFYIQL